MSSESAEGTASDKTGMRGFVRLRVTEEMMNFESTQCSSSGGVVFLNCGAQDGVNELLRFRVISALCPIAT
jgi:hypothetical protein